jgi:glutathione S-transferase
MKLTFSPASPFARKVRIAAIELGLDAFYQKMLERPSVKVSVPPAG